jgi:hypothetical protein
MQSAANISMPPGMDLRLVERDGKQFLEGPAGKPLIREVGDAVQIVEACLNHRANRVLLYTENLTERFFDLSSREAGEILQKFRNYHIRLAVVWSPEVRQLSHRFSDLMVEENRDQYFHLFAERPEAEAWLLEG